MNVTVNDTTNTITDLCLQGNPPPQRKSCKLLSVRIGFTDSFKHDICKFTNLLLSVIDVAD